MEGFDLAAFEHLPEAERREAIDLFHAQYGGPRLSPFIAEHWPHEPPPPHLWPILSRVERARTQRQKVCFSWPPRHAKTITFQRALTWWMKAHPGDLNAFVTYSDKKAWSKSRTIRRWAKQVGVPIAKEPKGVDEWRTVHGGGLLAAGLRSGITGMGISGLFVVDDPFKNRSEADSEIIRDRVYDEFNEVVFTRLEGASVFVVHTRWHEDDLIGRLERDGWEVINVPALAEGSDDFLGREPGECLWPSSRYDVAELESIRKQIGDWSFASLYQGRPRPKGAVVFGEPARYQLPESKREWQEFVRGKRFMLACDPAASTSTRADYSAIVVLAIEGKGPLAKFWVVDVFRERMEVPKLVDKLRSMQRFWRCPIAVEAAQGFKGVPQMLKHVDPNLRVYEINPTRDKFTRSQGAAAAWNDARVLVPTNADWVDLFLREVLSFTGVSDRHDDQVDALSHGWTVLASTGRRPKRGSRVTNAPFG